MTLKQLEYVVKVAECGTVSGAAKALFVAQPSLSAAIQELESGNAPDPVSPHQ